MGAIASLPPPLTREGTTAQSEHNSDPKLQMGEALSLYCFLEIQGGGGGAQNQKTQIGVTVVPLTNLRNVKMERT